MQQNGLFGLPKISRANSRTECDLSERPQLRFQKYLRLVLIEIYSGCEEGLVIDCHQASIIIAHKNPKASKQRDRASGIRKSMRKNRLWGCWFFFFFADFQISLNLCFKLITLNYLGPFRTNEVHLSETRWWRLGVAIREGYRGREKWHIERKKKMNKSGKKVQVVFD